MRSRFILTWIIYTIVFILLALLLNTTVVPRIANSIADSTSSWQHWDKNTYSLETCMKVLNGKVLATSDLFDMDMLADIYIEELNQFRSQKEVATNSDVGISESESGNQSLDKIEQETNALQLLSDTYSLDTRFIDVSDPDTLLLVSLDQEKPRWMSFSDLQSLAMERDSQANTNSKWQVFQTGDSIYARDLSVYYAFRDLKMPLVLLIYIIGLLIVSYLGYSRSLKYFDELSGAVASMISDREKPVKLSPQLAITQDELNTIRLGAIADERAAQAAERRKDELVAYLAHDIKTPLTSVMGYLMLMDEAPDLPEEARIRYIHTASEKAERLEDLIDEFFEITRYNLQAIPIERERINLRVLCEQVADEFYPMCEARNIQIKVDAPEDASAFIDPDKFARALGNVVRNAVSFATSESEVKISAELVDNDWKIEVVNEGREISPAHLESIFEKFYREDGARSSESGRSGLGLAIAKEIVVAHKGTIQAESIEGTTTFTILVPS